MKSPKPKPKPSEQPQLSLPEKLALAQQNAEKWQSLANDPDLSLPVALWARNLARGYRAQSQLYQKASQYQQQNDQALQRTLARALGTSPLPPDQAHLWCRKSPFIDRAGNIRLDSRPGPRDPVRQWRSRAAVAAHVSDTQPERSDVPRSQRRSDRLRRSAASAWSPPVDNGEAHRRAAGGGGAPLRRWRHSVSCH